MAVAGTEFILVHLSESLFKTPVVVMEAVDSADYSGAMAATRAVNEELARFRIINNFQKLLDLVHAGSALVNHRNVDVTQAGSLDRGLLILDRVVR